jgi:RNA recognition motif-containing protein
MATDDQSEQKRIFVGGLHHSIDERDIKTLFEKYGRVLSVHKVTRQSDLQTPG